MIGISQSTAQLAGFLLAQAAWSVSDTSEDELLVPLAVVDEGGVRTVTRFDGATQAEAISRGKASMHEATAVGVPWAFAREGAWQRGEGGTIDVLAIDFWGPGMSGVATVIQPFRRATGDDPFRIVGEPSIVLQGVLMPAPEAAPLLARLLSGVSDHPKVGPLWRQWTADGARDTGRSSTMSE